MNWADALRYLGADLHASDGGDEASPWLVRDCIGLLA